MCEREVFYYARDFLFKHARDSSRHHKNGHVCAFQTMEEGPEDVTAIKIGVICH